MPLHHHAGHDPRCHGDDHDRGRHVYDNLSRLFMPLAAGGGSGGSMPGYDTPLLVVIDNDGGKNQFWSYYPTSNSAIDANLGALRPTASLLQTGLIPDYGIADSAAAYVPFFGDGRAALVGDVGLLSGTQGHPEGLSELQRGVRTRGSTKATGILGNALDLDLGRPDDNAAIPPVVVVGRAFGSFALGGSGTYAYTFPNVQALERLAAGGGLLPLPTKASFRKMIEEGNTLFKYAGVTGAAYDASETTEDYGQPSPDTAAYVNGLATISRLIRGRLGACVYVLKKDGWDHHKDAGVNGGEYYRMQQAQAQGITAFLNECAVPAKL